MFPCPREVFMVIGISMGMSQISVKGCGIGRCKFISVVGMLWSLGICQVWGDGIVTMFIDETGAASPPQRRLMMSYNDIHV